MWLMIRFLHHKILPECMGTPLFGAVYVFVLRHISFLIYLSFLCPFTLLAFSVSQRMSFYTNANRFVLLYPTCLQSDLSNYPTMFDFTLLFLLTEERPVSGKHNCVQCIQWMCIYVGLSFRK